MPGGGWITRTVASKIRQARYKQSRSYSNSYSRSRGSSSRSSSSYGNAAGGYVANISSEMNFLFQSALANDKGPAGEGYDYALTMCGNPGQLAIIQKMGVSSFREAARYAKEGGDAVEILQDECKHPEAVEIILYESGNLVNDLVEDLQLASMGY